MKKKYFNKYKNSIQLISALGLSLVSNNIFASTYNCLIFGEKQCDITLSGNNNIMYVSGNIPNYVVSNSPDTLTGSHIIELKDFTYIDNFQYMFNNAYADPGLLLKTSSLYVLEINKLDAHRLTIEMVNNGSQNTLPLFRNAIFQSFKLNEIGIVPENSTWNVLEQKNTDINADLQLINKNTTISINYATNLTPKNKITKFIITNDRTKAESISLSINNSPDTIYISSQLPDDSIFLNNLTISNTNPNSSTVVSSSDIISNNFISNGIVSINSTSQVSMSGYIKIKTLYLSHSAYISNGLYSNAFIVENIKFNHTNIIDITILNQNAQIGKGMLDNNTKPNNPNDINSLGTFLLQDSNLSVLGYLEVKEFQYVGNDAKFFNITDGYFNNLSPNSLAMNMDKLNLDNARFESKYSDLTANNVDITSKTNNKSTLIANSLVAQNLVINNADLNLQTLDVSKILQIGTNSTITTNTLTTQAGSEVFINLNGKNAQNGPIFANQIIATGSTWNIDINTQGVLNSQNNYTYAIANGITSFDAPNKINVSSTPSWLVYNHALLDDKLVIIADRVTSYNAVLLNNNIDSTFSNTLAKAIDAEMIDSVSSDDLNSMISRIDAYSKDGIGLYNNLDSFKSMDRKYYINSLNINDTNSLDVIQENLFILNTLWFDYSYNWGENYAEYKDKSSKLMLGYNISLDDKNYLSMAFGYSLMNLNLENATSDLNNVALGLTYYRFFDTKNIYTNISLLGSINSSLNTRYDDMHGKYDSKNSYIGTLVGLLVGKDMKINDYINLTNNIYTNFNYITMNSYNEDSAVGYKYGTQDYNIIDSGYKIGFKYDRLNDYLWWKNMGWEASSAFGYKFSSGGGDNITLKIDNTKVSIEDNKFDLDGFVIKPKLALNYNYNKVKLEGAYEFEYVSTGYHQNTIKVIVKYKTS